MLPPRPIAVFDDVIAAIQLLLHCNAAMMAISLSILFSNLFHLRQNLRRHATVPKTGVGIVWLICSRRQSSLLGKCWPRFCRMARVCGDAASWAASRPCVIPWRPARLPAVRFLALRSPFDELRSRRWTREFVLTEAVEERTAALSQRLLHTSPTRAQAVDRRTERRHQEATRGILLTKPSSVRSLNHF